MDGGRTILVIRHAAHEGLGTFEDAIRSYHDGSWRVSELLAPEASSTDWDRARDAPVLILMGGAMGVYEAAAYPFLNREIALLARRVAADRPTLGICLGAQLIAQAAGARVVNSGRREVGWFPVSPTKAGAADPVTGRSGIDWTAPVFHWHQDTFETPPGAALLLSSARFEQQAFRLGGRVYGLQFHPEVPESDLPQWIAAQPKLPYGRVDGVQSEAEILAGGASHGASLQRCSRALLQGFLRLIS